MKFACPFCATELTVSRPVQHESELFACDACLNPIMLRMESGTIRAQGIEGQQDTRMLLDEGSITGGLFHGIKASIDDLPVLPEMSQRIVMLTNDEESSIQDLATLVSEDPVVASKVIQVANSAYYRGLSEITDIQSACARLGMRTVANTVQSVAMTNVFDTDELQFKETMRQLWRHSVAVAHLCSEIAILLSIPHSEMVYLMGLLHDIGKIAIVKVVADTDNPNTKALRDAESLFIDLLGRFHALVGLHVAVKWNIPAELATTIFFHHDPDKATTEPLRRLSHVVALANAIAHVTGFPSEYEKDVSLITSPSATFFSLSDVKLAALRVDLEDRMETFMGAIA
jgi:putative nucleotidyltransferase with HDIG domain